MFSFSMKLIKCIFNLIISRKFNLINSPFQFLCFIEYLKKNKNTIKNSTVVYVGYCSISSKAQIKNINTKIYQTNFKIYFLDEIFNIKIFHAFFFILKKLKRNFLISVCGTYQYYLFKEFIKKSNETILLDDGIDTLSVNNNEELNKFKTSFFTCFPIKDSGNKVLMNDFSYMKQYKNKNIKIDENLVYCIGTSFFINKSRSSGQKKHLNDLIEYFKDKTIYYFPHRDEKIDSNIFRKLHVEVINIPIELYLLQSNVLPKNICGFYSTALYTLKKYLLFRFSC